MTQMPPPQGVPQPPAYVPPPQSGTNGAAVASLICGILGCIPVVTSLAAIILGIVGIKKAKPPMGGKGLAIGGIVLGLIGLIIWGAIGGASVWGYGYYKKFIASTEAVSTGFFSNLASGNYAAAASATTGKLTPADLESLGDQVKSLGAFKSFSITQATGDGTAGNQVRLRIAGTAQFDKGSKTFEGVFVGDPTAGFKIEDMTLE